MLKRNCSTDYSKMHHLVAWLFVFSVMSMVNGKTEQEWTKATDQLMNEFSAAYSSGNETAAREKLTANVHVFFPGQPEMIGFTGPVISIPGKLTLLERKLVTFCGTEAVVMSKIVCTFNLPSGIRTTRYGKSMALVVDESGTVKLQSYIWNFDD